MSLGKVGLLGEKGEAKRLQVDSASLADLKAELFRKKGEAHKNKQKGNYRPEKTGEKKMNIWSKENTGILARMHKDMEEKLVEDKSNERVKTVLERKARLYDSLKKGKGRSEVSQGMLVDFGKRRRSDSDSDSDDGKRDYPANDEDEEWVEYTDMLGRTRTCMKKDLSKLKEQDKDLKCDDDKEQKNQEKEEKKRNQEELDMLSEDMRRELLRQKWEKEEMENLKKDNLHYGDVVFDEARTLGAGYYAFSRDEEKRQQEQDTLKKLHEETDDARKIREKKAEKRKKDMAERIKKIKRKRREKLGLPPEESEDEEEAEKTMEDEEDDQNDISKSVLAGLKMFRRDNEDEERRKNELQRRANTRDWDVGKEEVEEWKVEKKVMDQKEWVDKQRKMRNKDFAPPTATAYAEARYFIMNNEAKNLDANKQKKFPKKLPQLPDKPVTKDDISHYKSSYFNYTGQSAGQNTTFAPPNVGFPPPNLAVPPPAISIPPPTGSIPQHPPPPLPARKSKFDLDPMANLDVNPEPQMMGPDPKPPNQWMGPEPNLSQPPVKPISQPSAKPMYSQQIRIELHKRMKNQEFVTAPTSGLNRNIINELEAFQESDSDEDDECGDRGKGNEVAPPCDMEYYTSSSTWNPDRNKGARSHFDMAEAFSAGVKAQNKSDETDSD